MEYLFHKAYRLIAHFPERHKVVQALHEEATILMASILILSSIIKTSITQLVNRSLLGIQTQIWSYPTISVCLIKLNIVIHTWSSMIGILNMKMGKCCTNIISQWCFYSPCAVTIMRVGVGKIWAFDDPTMQIGWFDYIIAIWNQ